MKKLTVFLLVIALFAIPVNATAFSINCFDQLFGYSEPKPAPKKVVPPPEKKPVAPSSQWKQFKEKVKPKVKTVSKPEQTSTWSKLKFWEPKTRGTEDETSNVTDERFTTIPAGS